MDFQFLKWIHLFSATLLFGTGLGSAFYKWNADRSGNLQAIAHTNKIVVIADWVFTTPTVILQPITGIYLATLMGIPLSEQWILAAITLYVIAGACWIPVVWLQIQMSKLSNRALSQQSSLDKIYHRYARTWFWLGIPAFTSMIVIYFLMVFKPLLAV